MVALDVSKEEDLALELRHRYGLLVKQSSINRWLRGERNPSYEPTMTLLAACGWLNEEAISQAGEPRGAAGRAQRRGAEAARGVQSGRSGRKRATG